MALQEAGETAHRATEGTARPQTQSFVLFNVICYDVDEKNKWVPAGVAVCVAWARSPHVCVGFLPHPKAAPEGTGCVHCPGPGPGGLGSGCAGPWEGTSPPELLDRLPPPGTLNWTKQVGILWWLVFPRLSELSEALMRVRAHARLWKWIRENPWFACSRPG